MRRQLPVLLLALLALASPARARETKLRAEVDAQRVGIEDTVELTLTVEGSSPGDPRLGALKNLQVAGGPSVSTQMSFVNGAFSQSRTYTWVLQGVAVGPAEVPPIQVGDRSTAPIAVEVVAGSVKARRQRRPDPFGDPFGDAFGDPFGSVLGRRPRRGPVKVFAEAVPSRTELHVGEPVLLRYLVYTQTSLTDVQFAEAPKYPGFWSEDLEMSPAPPGGETVTVEGEAYQRFTVHQRLLFPTKAGRLTIPSVTLKLGLPRQSFFDRGGGVVERPIQAVALTVKPLPEAAGFSGAVGRFSVSASLDRPAVPLGEAATLRFRVEGSGNLKWVEKGPELTLKGARSYPPRVLSELRSGPDGVAGARTWEYVVVPETAGVVEIPPLAFTYFDPQMASLVRRETASLRLEATSATTGTAPLATAPARSRAEGGLALRSDLDLPARWPSPGGRTVALGLGAVLALHGALWAGSRLRERRRQTGGRTAARGSVRSALHDLGRLERAATSKEAAAATIEKALHDAFGEALDRTEGGSEGLQAARAVLQEVFFIRYAPQLGDYTEKVHEVTRRAADVIRRWA